MTERSTLQNPSPLSSAELRAMWERNPCAEVKALLWEIKRLHTTLVIANDLCVAVEGRHTKSELQAVSLRERLDQEPCITEYPETMKRLAEKLSRRPKSS